MKKILVITYTGDNESIEMVSAAIEKQGSVMYRLDTDLLPHEIPFSFYFDGKQWKNIFHLKDGDIDVEEIDSIWYRRSKIGANFKDVMPQKFIEPAIKETRCSLIGMLVASDAYRFCDYLKVRSAENKQLQLKLAHQCGLKIAPTLISNDASAAKDFIKSVNEQAISKMQSSFAIYEDDKELVVFTNEVDSETSLEGLHLCPMQFQQKLEKKLELRVTIVGKKVFAAAIDSASFKGAELDWRKEGMALIEQWEKYDLPQDVEENLLKLMDLLELDYGAADIIVTPDGEHYFLEVNPAGEFFWMEKYPPYFPISDAIAEMLLGNVEHR